MTGRGASISIPADYKAMDGVRSLLRKSLEGIDLAEEEYFKIELSLHEICVNIVLYAYPARGGDLVLRTWFEGRRIFFEFRDSGVPFDPQFTAFPDIREKLRTGKRGGFGIFLFRTLMDGYEYRREAGTNVLTVFKDLPESAGPGSI
ncbi:MAG: ATP-binding protein [Candidatus Aminicenantales bacterium]